MVTMIPLMPTANGEDSSKGRIESLRNKLVRLPQLIREGWRADLVALRNWWRRRRNEEVEFVVFRLAAPLPERSGPPRSFVQRQLPLPPRPLSLQTLNARLLRLADAGNVRGAVFVLGNLSGMGTGRLQNLRRSLMRLREAGKEVVVYTPYLDMTHYYVASAAGAVYAPPGAQFDVVGLQSEAIFLHDALEKMGVEAEVLRVSPYKTAGNLLSESGMTPEQERQMSWLLDDTYEALTADIAKSRGLTQDRLNGLIDQAPFSADQAVAYDLLDGLAYEDELPHLLRTGDEPPSLEESNDSASGSRESGVRLLAWSQARRRLMEKVRRPSRKVIGVLTVDGLIAMGASRQPPVNLPIPLVGGAIAGEETIVKLLRQAGRDDAMAGLILHVESGGGSSLASELIWREIVQLKRKKPVLAYLGDVAASGGYFVSAGAARIMSQRCTITGSIGVILARMNPSSLLDKLAIQRASVSRGAHAGIYSEPRALREEERALLWQLLQDNYRSFKEVVAEGRGIPAEEIEPIAGGRVWTGRQAKDRGLVDTHGDFVDAVNQLAELCGLAVDDEDTIRTTDLFSTTETYLPPQSGTIANELADMLSASALRSMNGHPLLLMPMTLRQS